MANVTGITENNSVDLLKEAQDVPTTLAHFCFLSSLLWQARGSPATPHFPLYRTRSFLVSLKKNSSRSYLLLKPHSSVSHPTYEANLTSLLICFTPGFTIAIGLSKLSARDRGAENTTLYLLAAPMPATRATHLWPFSCHISRTNCSWRGNWAENHPKQNRNRQLRPIG